MARDRKAEKQEEKKRMALERKREEEAARKKEEERHERARQEELEFERREELQRQQAARARRRSAERRKHEKLAHAMEERRKEEQAAAHRDERQSEVQASRLREAAQEQVGEERVRELRANEPPVRRKEPKRERAPARPQPTEKPTRIGKKKEGALPKERKGEVIDLKKRERQSEKPKEAKKPSKRKGGRPKAPQPRPQPEPECKPRWRERFRSRGIGPTTRLSNGLPRLMTSGNQIVRADKGEEGVILRGVNRSGLEYSEPTALGFLDGASLSQTEIQEIIDGWGANIIRLPFNQDWALNGRGTFTAEEYLDSIDQVVYWASSCGAYTLLDLQWLDADTPFGYGEPLGKPGQTKEVPVPRPPEEELQKLVNRVAPLPNADSIILWQKLAERYRNEPAVLFDLFNEPHEPIVSGVNPWRNDTMTQDKVDLAAWKLWALQLVKTIRDRNGTVLIFVSGFNWAFTLEGMPIIDPASGHPLRDVVYSTHVYPHFTETSDWVESWNRAFGNLARSGLAGQPPAPVFAGEWGVEEGFEDKETYLGFAERLGLYLSANRLGWTAWSWTDKPRIVRKEKGRYVPTRYGYYVQQFLAYP